MTTWKRIDLRGPEYKTMIEALLSNLPDGSTLADATRVLAVVIRQLPDAQPAGIKEIAEHWEAKRSTAMERIRRLQAADRWIKPAADVSAATLYDMADVEALAWEPRPLGRRNP